MPNSSGTWKTGEKVVRPGHYVCLNCRDRGQGTEVSLETDQIFPYCTVCDIKDNTWKETGGRG